MIRTAAWIQVAGPDSGGHRYGEDVRRAVRDVLPIALEDIRASGPLRPLLMQARLSALRASGRYDLLFLDNAAALAMPLPRTPRHVVVVYHVGVQSISRRLERMALGAIQPFALRHLRDAEVVVTICKFWEARVRALGNPRVRTIYNGFDLDEFDIPAADVDALRAKRGLTKPIVYIGNCQRAKGVVESHAALRDLDVHLVTSGRPLVNIPALNVNGSWREYLTLLAASSVVVTMSKFDEGWCRTAHEAMLLGRPVVGSGRGGMGELLSGGRQPICPRFDGLRGEVERLLADAAMARATGEQGREYARTFTAARFRQAWTDLLGSL